MRDKYEEIFTKRGLSYHDAMSLCSDAREEEFSTLLGITSLRPDYKVADMPSGGCYLKKYIAELVSEIYFVDPTKNLLKECDPQDNLILASLTDTPFQDDFLDVVFSLAGIHHITNKMNVYSEINRILKTGGKFIYADVMARSKEDDFLNSFVDGYNSLGHKGVFLDEGTRDVLSASGFTIQHCNYKEYYWKFNSENEMIDYVKKLFSLDLATDKIILQALKNILGYKQVNKIYKLNWGLYFIAARKINGIQS